MNILVKLILNTIAIMITAYILPGVHISNFFVAFAVTIVLGIANVILKPVLVILTFPVTIVTLGLFTCIINGVIVLLVSAFVPGFKVDGLLWAILFSIVLSIVNAFLSMLK